MRISAVLLLIWIAWFGDALAHGEAWWIERGGYRNAEGVSCCGPNDCWRLPAGAVGRVPGGFRVRGRITIPEDRAIPSPDDGYWMCVNVQGVPRCFFAPFPGA